MIPRWHLLLLAVLVNTESGDSPSSAPADDRFITVASYNVLHHTDTFLDEVQALVLNTPRPTYRIATLLELLVNLDADIIARQEVTPALLTAIDGDTRLHAWQVASTLSPPSRGWRRLLATAASFLLGIQPCGQAILSRRPIGAVHVHPMGRPLLVADIDIGGLTLRGATCHLDSFAEHQQKRIWQRYLSFRQLGSARHAMLLGGFNFGDAAPENAAIASGFRDLWREVHADRPGNTLGLRGNADTAASTGKTKHLDRILLHSPQLREAGIGLFGTETVTHGGRQLYLSDHYGIVAHLYPAAP